MKGKIFAAALGSYLALSPSESNAQASLDPPVRIGNLEEKAVLDDSADTWHKILDVNDPGKPGDIASVGLKVDRLNINSKKAQPFNREYNRADLRYCIIDRDPRPDRNPECGKFPERGKLNVPEWATNGYFSFFLEVPGSEKNKVARADEYMRLPKPTGTRRFTRTAPAEEAPAPETGTTAEAGAGETGTTAGREERAAPAGSRRFEERAGERAAVGREAGRPDERREAGERTAERERATSRVSVSGDYEEGLETSAEAAPIRIQRTGVNISARLTGVPEGSIKTADSENPQGAQKINLDRAFRGELATGYDGTNGSGGLFLRYDKIDDGIITLDDLWFGFAGRLDAGNGHRETHLRLNIGPYFHRFRHSVGEAYSVREKNEGVAAAADGSIEFPKLFFNGRHFNAGIFDDAFLRHVSKLLSISGDEDISYGPQRTFVNRLGPRFASRIGDFTASLKLGWEYDVIPTIRPNTEGLPERAIYQPRLEDYLRLSRDAARKPFSGHQLVAVLDIQAGKLKPGVFYSHPLEGDAERHAIGISLGYGNRFAAAYEFGNDSVEMAGRKKRTEILHLFSLQAGTDFDRLLLPDSTMAPNPILR